MVVLFSLIVVVSSVAALRRELSSPVAAGWGAVLSTAAWIVYSVRTYGWLPLSIMEWAVIAILYWALAILIVHLVRWGLNRAGRPRA